MGASSDSGSGDSGSSDSGSGPDLFNIGVATIFAREILEACIIIGNYRTVIHKSEYFSDEKKTVFLRAVTVAAFWAAVVAVLVVLAVAIPLGVLSRDFDDKTADIIEGVSKVVASICILQLSVKIPVWLGLYRKVKIKTLCFEPKQKEEKKDLSETLTVREIRFNVSWNIWREIAECGVFLIPFFLDNEEIGSIPLSAVIGTFIALVLGAAIYYANHRFENKFWLALFMSGLTLMLAVGLFTGGCHEFEEVWGETRKVWAADNDFWSHKKFPMVVFKPFGYSSSRTVLQITCFWLSLAFSLLIHFLKFKASEKAAANDDDADQEVISEDLENPNKEVESNEKTSEEEENSDDVVAA